MGTWSRADGGGVCLEAGCLVDFREEMSLDYSQI